MLISDGLADHQMLLAAALPTTVVIPVKYGTWTLPDLLHGIQVMAGVPNHQFRTFAIFDHGAPGEFNLLKNVAGGSIDLYDFKAEADEKDELSDFFKTATSYIAETKTKDDWDTNRIDLLGCCVAASETGLRAECRTS